MAGLLSVARALTKKPTVRRKGRKIPKKQYGVRLKSRGTGGVSRRQGWDDD